MNRKKFIQLSGLASASLFVPQFLKAVATSGAGLSKDAKLVVIQLSGGNDWLNTIVPYKEAAYAAARPSIRVQSNKVIGIDREMGLHPALRNLARLYEAGDLCIYQGVGYPNPNRSHFESMNIWHSAETTNNRAGTGWLGRALDTRATPKISAIELDDNVNLALVGKEIRTVAFKNLNQFYQSAKDPFLKSLGHAEAHHNELATYLYKQVSETSETAVYLQGLSRKFDKNAPYPRSRLGRDLKLVANLMLADCDKSVYYASMDGFDTHIGQLSRQQSLMTELDDALGAFVKQLDEAQKMKEVLVMVFSEFGRRVAENASHGTDHGAAGNVLLLSRSLRKKGLQGSNPNLEELQDGDIKYATDFREIYATILQKWLGMPSEPVLGSGISTLSFI